MSWRRVGLAMGMGVSLCGCYQDSDNFNAKAAEYVCRYNNRDPEMPFLNRTDPSTPPADSNPSETGTEAKYEPYNGPYCEDVLEANLASCSTQCEYSPRKARRCLRKLERGLSRDAYNDSELAVCDRVYDCSSAVSADVVDQCRISTQSCAVGDQRPPVVLFVLGFLGLWVRRRR